MSGLGQLDFVDYRNLDPVKRQAMEAFSTTLQYPGRLNIRVMPTGESGAVLDFLDYDFMLGFNVEGLGTKIRICDIMYAEMVRQGFPNPERVYRSIGQDTAAMSGGEIKVSEITEHVRTNIWVIEQFLPVKFEIDGKIIRVVK